MSRLSLAVAAQPPISDCCFNNIKRLRIAKTNMLNLPIRYTICVYNTHTYIYRYKCKYVHM